MTHISSVLKLRTQTGFPSPLGDLGVKDQYQNPPRFTNLINNSKCFTLYFDKMTPLFKKLNFKDQSPIAILDAPEEFHPAMEAMREFAEIHQTPQKGLKYGFYLAFVRSAAEMAAAARGLSKSLDADAVFWIAYPKKSSKKYKSDINRDSGGWTVLGSLGYEGVRSVAIDEDWSALRFRDVTYFKR